MTIADIINRQAAALVPLAQRFAAQHGEHHDLSFERVEVSRWRIIIYMRPRPAVLEQRDENGND